MGAVVDRTVETRRGGIVWFILPPWWGSGSSTLCTKRGKAWSGVECHDFAMRCERGKLVRNRFAFDPSV